MARYVPKLSATSICRLKRLSWALNKPMTTTLDQLIHVLCQHLDQQLVCNACHDRSRCELCGLQAMHTARRTPVTSSQGHPVISLSEFSSDPH